MLIARKLKPPISEGEKGSLHQLSAQQASGNWDLKYSGGNSVHIDSKC